MLSPHQETTWSPDKEISFDFWLPFLWFHWMATWLWPIASALRATKSQDQHQAMSTFLRNNPSKALVHIQIWMPTRDFTGYGQNNSLQNCRKFSLWIQGRTPALLNPWLGGGCGPLPGMRGDTQSSHQAVGLHRLRDCSLWGTAGLWVQPEMSRKLSEADGHLQRPCWERTAVSVHGQASEPVEERAARAFSAPMLSLLCFCKALY